jgi:type II secretory pathway pseudopilin PulG
MNHKIVHIVPSVARDGYSQQAQKGYVLLAVMLLITLMMVAMSVELPRIAQQVQRQKEEELVNRGMDYARAVKRFYHKSNTYPSSIEQLKDTNHIRFLRKEYKDPITGESEWKLVHMNEAEIKIPQGTGVQGLQGSNPGLAGGNNPGGQPAGTAGLNPSSAGAAGGTGFSGGGTGLSGGGTGLSGGSTGLSGGSSGLSGGGTGLSGEGTGLSGGSTGLSGGSTGLSGGSTGLSGSSTGLSGGTQTAPGQGSGSAPTGGVAPQGGSGALQTSNIGLGNSGPSQIGGGQIIGFASTSKKTSIKEFNDKNEYDQWYFVYDPRLEQTGPNQMGSATAGLIIAAPRGGAAGAAQGTPGALTGSQPTQPNGSAPAGSATPQVPR